MRFPTVREGLGWMTIPEMIERSGEHYGNLVALKMKRDGEWVQYTYREVLDKVRRLAKALKDMGLEKGERVALIGENRPEWAISYLAISWAGGIVVPLDPRLTPSEWRHILDDSESKLVISSGRYLSDIISLGEDLPHLKKVISMDPAPNMENIPEILGKVKEPIQRESIVLDDLAVILYTSGTTGSSKGVMLTHKNIMSNVDAIYQCIDFGPGDTFFSILPLHHVFEATAGFLAALYGGTTIVYARSLKPNEMREDMLETRPTLFLVVPLLLEKILQGIKRELRKASPIKRGLFYSLKGFSKGLGLIIGKRRAKALLKTVRMKTGMGYARYIISGGAALPKWVSKGLEELGFPILQGYGLSETSPVLTVNPPKRPRNESVGLPIPYVEIKIINPGPDGVGEIAAKGPNIMKGYYRNEEATREVLTEDGWLLTGDLGYIDKEGYLYITGRKKSVIVTRGGKNIYPEEVENELLKSPFIEEILVLRGANPRTGEEEVQAIVYPNFENLDLYFKERGIRNPTERDINRLIGEEIQKYSANLADYKRPKRFTIREEEFPKTTTRKIKRYLFEKPSVEIE
jgi:long-chain acyl-CoA synthetase